MSDASFKCSVNLIQTWEFKDVDVTWHAYRFWMKNYAFLLLFFFLDSSSTKLLNFVSAELRAQSRTFEL